MKLKLGNMKRILVAAVALSAASGAAMAQNFISNKAEAEQLLKGATLIGIYLRTETAYTLKFGTDGSLTDTSGAKARWWIDDQGRYCREWLDGKLWPWRSRRDTGRNRSGSHRWPNRRSPSHRAARH